MSTRLSANIWMNLQPTFKRKATNKTCTMKEGIKKAKHLHLNVLLELNVTIYFKEFHLVWITIRNLVLIDWSIDWLDEWFIDD